MVADVWNVLLRNFCSKISKKVFRKNSKFQNPEPILHMVLTQKSAKLSLFRTSRTRSQQFRRTLERKWPPAKIQIRYRKLTVLSRKVKVQENIVKKLGCTHVRQDAILQKGQRDAKIWNAGWTFLRLIEAKNLSRCSFWIIDTVPLGGVVSLSGISCAIRSSWFCHRNGHLPLRPSFTSTSISLELFVLVRISCHGHIVTIFAGSLIVSKMWKSNFLMLWNTVNCSYTGLGLGLRFRVRYISE